MDEKELKRWRSVAIFGTVFMALCLIVSIIQFVEQRINNETAYIRYIALFINAFAFLGFFLQIFAPKNWYLSAVIFYVYGTGNFFDSGNVLGTLCIILAVLFLVRQGFFYKNKILKILLLSIVPLWALVNQIFANDYVYFLVSLFHILGLIFLSIVFYNLFYEKLNSMQNHHERMELSPELCSEDELKILTMLAEGKKYSHIAKQFNMSESKLKQRVLELYKMLGVKSKTEFLTDYNGCVFYHKN